MIGKLSIYSRLHKYFIASNTVVSLDNVREESNSFVPHVLIAHILRKCFKIKVSTLRLVSEGEKDCNWERIMVCDRRMCDEAVEGH